MKTLTTLCLLFVAAACSDAVAQPAALTAAPVKERIRITVQSNGDVPGKGEQELVYRLDGATNEFESFAPDQQFAVKARGSVAITVPRFNPLTTSIAVEVEDAADPANAIMGKLVESLASVSTILGAQIPAALDRSLGDDQLRGARTFTGCDPQFNNATAAILRLHRALNDEAWSGTTIKREIDKASEAIDEGFGGGGAHAVGAGVKSLEAFLGGSDRDSESGATLRGALKEAAAAVDVVETAAKANHPAGCDSSVQYLYVLASVANPSERLTVLTRIVKTFEDIVDTLKLYAGDGRWSTAIPSDFVARRGLNPTSAIQKNVKVTYSKRAYERSSSGVISVKTTETASVEFVVRRYSAWVPEIGVGLTLNRVDRPVYGTGKNAANETVIAKSESDTSTKVDPTVMVNFICGFCGIGSLARVTPMFQVGASTSKTTPAILFGGGIRIFATSKGEFALGYGWIWPWVKQLKDERDLGKTIGGTADLEQYLEWRLVRGNHPYFSLQYKF